MEKKKRQKLRDELVRDRKRLQKMADSLFKKAIEGDASEELIREYNAILIKLENRDMRIEDLEHNRNFNVLKIFNSICQD